MEATNTNAVNAEHQQPATQEEKTVTNPTHKPKVKERVFFNIRCWKEFNGAKTYKVFVNKKPVVPVDAFNDGWLYDSHERVQLNNPTYVAR